MHRQRVSNPPIKAVQGLLIVVGLLAVLMLDSAVTRLLAAVIGSTVSALLFWIVGIAVALWTMRRYVLAYSYALSGTMLQVTFAYGRYERAMAQVYLNSVLFTGTPEEAKTCYPDSRKQTAVRPRCEIEPMAAVYNDGRGTVILTLQPDEKIREALNGAARGKKKS